MGVTFTCLRNSVSHCTEYNELTKQLILLHTMAEIDEIPEPLQRHPYIKCRLPEHL